MGLTAPVNDFVITSPYGWRELNGKKEFHDGIDFANPGHKDTRVMAVADGVIVYDKDNYDEAKRWTDLTDSIGNAVIIQHLINNKFYFLRYCHLGENTVSRGKKVKAGDVIGTYADVGYSFGAHLHLDAYESTWKKFSIKELWES
jgi:murein DD-endopeptidase MepM/ murein hydrolase activator NlpD